MTATHVHRLPTFAELRDDFVDIVGDIVYCTMTTVDRRGRPRSRVLIVAWEIDQDGPTGWLATFKTPVKAAHLAHNPHVTTSYWSPAQDVVYVDSVAGWVDDPGVKRDVWSLYRRGGPPGVGYDPQAYWPGGPDDAGYHVLRLRPWRIQVLRGRDLVSGRPSRIWQRLDQAPLPAGADRAPRPTRHI